MPSMRDSLPPIAIVGMGLRLPGGISTPEDFWHFLVNKRDGRCRVPNDRYNVEAFHNGKAHGQTVASDYGYFLQDVNLKSFDASFFSMSQTEVENLDPQQRLLLEVVWECMESAGQINWRGRNIGCYIGVFGQDWHDMMMKDTQDTSLYHVTGAGDFALSNRISYEYDLSGPSLTIRTACSSSLICLHEACQALYNGDCSSAIVAGTNLIMGPSMTLAMSEQGVLSPAGLCRTFDADADGYARGEAVNAVYIKLLDDAIRDHDPVRAIIRATASNCDGKTAGIACPSAESHERMIRTAYEMAGVSDLSQTPYVECHGTGTAIGDPLEATAIANAFGNRGTYIGSVKPNVGHSEGASGITSLIKAVLALENGIIPPNINFSKPNPKIPFQTGNLQVPVDATTWPKDRHPRVSVNSFGIGGANAHIILDSAASFGIQRPPVTLSISGENTNRHYNGATRQWPNLFTVSANSAESLQMRVENLQRYVKSRLSDLNVVAHTLGARRDHLLHRTFCISKQGDEQLEFECFQKISPAAPKVVFVFTGQGAQWAGMGKDLILSSTSFCNDIREMDRILQGLADAPQWTIEGILCSEGAGNLLGQAEFSQPLCTALQIALTNFLNKCGVIATAIIGHSSGEIAGAYAAGAINLEKALLVSYYRGLATKLQTQTGGMIAVGLSQDAVKPCLIDGAVVACENSPNSVTLSGDLDALETTLQAIKTKYPDVFAKRLCVDMAYHSHHMREVGHMYAEMLMQLQPGNEAVIPFYSSVTGERLRAKALFDSAYWRSNLESPVRFNTAVQCLLDDVHGEVLFLELGPHSALKGALREIFQKHSNIPHVYIPTLIRDNDPVASVCMAIGQLYAHGLAVDFSTINPPTSILTNLPNYPWDHKREFWNENRLSLALRHKKHPHHELLGSMCLEANDIEPAWRSVLRTSDVPWLKDHKIVNDIVFPCAGYIAMMGEAVRQRTGSETYTLQSLVMKSALVLSESEAVEIMTTMKPSRLTDSANSSWYDFSIWSFDGTSWAQNCVAQGKPGQDHSPPERPIYPHPRKLRQDFWYERMRYLGLNYGPRFQGLKEISAHTMETVATATIQNDEDEQLAKYSVHPITIDLSLQLFTVAMTNGLARRLGSLTVPCTVGYVSVKPWGTNLVAEATASIDAKGSIRGQVVAITEANEVIIDIQNAAFTALEAGNQTDDMDLTAACRLVWRPDINFLNIGGLVQPSKSKRGAMLSIEKFCALCILRTLDALDDVIVPPGYLTKFATWLQEEKARMARGEWALFVPEAEKWVSLDAESRDSLLESTNSAFEADQEILKLRQLCNALSDTEKVRKIFLEEVNPLQLMMEGDRLGSLYNFSQDLIDCDEFFSLCAHAQPTLKVLEIGAGTGGTTMDVLKALLSKDGTRMYSQYTFTDISSGFFTAAKERFLEYTGLDYKVLDISRDPAEQGFDHNSYDLIVASNVLHATPSLQKTLLNVRALLRPGGRLFLHEMIIPMRWKWIRFITGFLPGWWLGEADNRLTEPIVSAERWDKELREAGFSGTDTVVLDDDVTYHINGIIVATAVKSVTRSTDVTFLYKTKKVEFARELACRFEKDGVNVHWRRISDQEHIPGQNIVSTIEIEGPYFHDISASDYETFTTYLSKFRGGMLWLTRAAQIHCTDPRYGSVVGLARTIRNEISSKFITMELQCLDSVTADAVLAVIGNSDASSPSPDYDPEPEYAVHDGVIQTGRYHWISASKELEADLQDSELKRLAIGRYGLIDSLQWVHHESTTLRADEVEVDIRCAGLNFRDVLIAMGIIDGPKGMLGFEASGVITRVGSAIDQVKIGDRVMTMGIGCFATRHVSSGQLVARIPEHMSFEDAATMPIVYATVIHSIILVGQLAKGQSILIHSACGGVGLAALQICRMLGAEIYVTVGNEEKVQYLMDNFGVVRERIFHSRNISFLHNVLQVTGGRGVDMVLNSLSGELFHASWQCVAKFGKMLEIGKRDIVGCGRLALEPFQGNRTFHGIDLGEIMQQHPERVRRLMENCVRYYQQGHIKPIRPIKSYPAEHVTEAYRYMQSGQHIGKILIIMPEKTIQIPACNIRSQASLSSKSTYLMVGGLGGLGRALTTWMVERGGRSFVFLSRSAGKSSRDQAFIRELESQGCYAVALAGSVADVTAVKRAVQHAPTPIAGVMQMSMVLRDGPILQAGYDDWNSVQNPKVRGTWNLHEAFLGTDLKFFILFGSVSAIWGMPGQGNYASANSFLDSFVQYRQSLHLPCSVVDVGVMEGIGYVSQNLTTLSQLLDMGAYTLQEQALVDAIEISMGRSLPPKTLVGPPSGFCSMGQLSVGMRASKPLSDPRSRTPWKRDIRMSLYRQLELTDNLGTKSSRSVLQVLLSSIATCPELLHDLASLELVTSEIGRALCSFMQFPEENFDVTMSLSSMGIDSLVSIEIRNWWRRVLGVDISVLEIITAGSVKRLGTLAIELLQEKHNGKQEFKAVAEEYLRMKAPLEAYILD